MAGRDYLVACAIAAGRELVDPPQTHRMRLLRAVLDEVGDEHIDLPIHRAGWGLLADVIRSDRPLPLEHGRGYHDHLVAAGAAAARELAPLLAGDSLLDLGGGAGTYTAAYLDAHPHARATIVDAPDVIELAKENLARFADRVTFVAGDARQSHAPHDVALLANVLHLHGADACKQIVDAAMRAAPRVVVKDLRADTLEGKLFALGMAIYTDAGDVYTEAQIRAWLGHRDAVNHRLAITDHLVLVADTPFERYPRSFTRTLERAVIDEPTVAASFVEHYARVMPAQRAIEPDVFRVALDWSRLPRLERAIANLEALVDGFAVPRAATLGELYAQTHYGAAMPLLYGGPDALAWFAAREPEPHAMIDRYLVAPIIHELSHLDRERDGVGSVHLDECLAGWLGMLAHRELVYPAPGHDDALFAAPFLSQIGQAFARRFGTRATIRAHAGIEPLPIDVAAPAWADWRRRKTLHLLSDTMDPAPWVGLAFTGELAPPDLAAIDLPDDDAEDRAIFRDALTAMCLVGIHPRLAFPVEVELRDGWLTAPARDGITPRHWTPPRVARLGRRSFALSSLADIDAIVDSVIPRSSAP